MHSPRTSRCGARARGFTGTVRGIAGIGPARKEHTHEVLVECIPSGGGRLLICGPRVDVTIGPASVGLPLVKSGVAEFDGSVYVAGPELDTRAALATSDVRYALKRLQSALPDLSMKDGVLEAVLPRSEPITGPMLIGIVDLARDVLSVLHVASVSPVAYLFDCGREDTADRERVFAILRDFSPTHDEIAGRLARLMANVLNPGLQLAAACALPAAYPHREQTLLDLLAFQSLRGRAIAELRATGTVLAIPALRATDDPSATAAIDAIQSRLPNAATGQLSIAAAGGELSEPVEAGSLSIAEAKKQST